MKKTNKILALVMAIAMIFSMMSVLSYADIGDTDPMQSYTATYFPYCNLSGTVFVGIWAGLKGDSTDFTTFKGSDLE